MAYTLKDEFDATPGGYNTVRDTRWVAQTFLTTSAYTCDRVSLYCAKYGSPTSLKVAIYSTSSGIPDSELASVTIDATTLPAVADVAWVDFDFSTPANLSSGTLYAIVLSSSGTNFSNNIRWYGYVTFDDEYADGSLRLSTNSGSSWESSDSGHDISFRTYTEETSYKELAGSSSITFGSTASLTGTVLDLSGSTGITFGSASNLEAYISLSGTTGITFSLTGGITGSLSLSGTAGITFGSSAILIFGPPSGDKIEKYGRILVLIGNDCAYYQDS